jgi:hypothetical protein
VFRGIFGFPLISRFPPRAPCQSYKTVLCYTGWLQGTRRMSRNPSPRPFAALQHANRGPASAIILRHSRAKSHAEKAIEVDTVTRRYGACCAVYFYSARARPYSQLLNLKPSRVPTNLGPGPRCPLSLRQSYRHPQSSLTCCCRRFRIFVCFSLISIFAIVVAVAGFACRVCARRGLDLPIILGAAFVILVFCFPSLN